MTSALQLAHTGALSLGAAAEILSVRGHRLQYHWWEVRDLALARDAYACQICGKRGTSRTLQMHHIVPVRWGGNSEPDNLATLCPACHSRLHQEHRVFRGRRTFEDDEGAC